MAFQDLPIKRKLTWVIVLTTFSVLVLTAAVFLIHDLISFKQLMVRNVRTTAAIIADNSTAAIAFKNEKDARETLGSVHADPHIVAAALYDEENNIYTRYPPNAPVQEFPLIPGPTGVPTFEKGYLSLFEPVMQ